MSSTYSTRNRAEKQGTGENTNTWGTKLNTTAIDVIDAALDGVESYALSGSKTLTSTNGSATAEAIQRVQWITSGTGGTVTIPGVEKMYIVKNDASGAVTFDAGGTTAQVAAGTMDFLFCDGTDVYAANYASGGVSANSITNSLLADMAVNTIKGRVTAGTGDPEDLTAAQVRTVLSLVPGTNVQAYSANTNALANATTAAADTLVYWTSTTAAAFTSLSSFGRTLIDDASASAARTTLGVAIGTNVQAYDADLTTLGGLAKTDGNFIVGNGSAWVAESGATARTSLGLGSIATANVTAQSGGSPSGGSNGDIYLIY